MRHAVFFDRWASEVMGLESGSFRERLHEIEDRMLGPWHFLFDDSLREIANRIKDRPDDLELFVEGIVTYHMVTEGVLAMPGQRIMIEYTADHDLYPGFNEGFRLVEQDEHRHIAFGVRFLKDVCDERPEMKGRDRLRRLEELLPKAAEVFCPPEADDPSRLRLLRPPLLADLRLRLPGAEAAHGGDRDRDPAAGAADAGPGRLRRVGGEACAR